MGAMEDIKELRTMTGAGMMECKGALKEADGDKEKAIEILRKKGVAKAAKKASRTASQGIVESYIHMGSKIGVLVEVNCETDFVARNEDFKAFCKDLAMQVAAAHPLYLTREDVPEKAIEKEKDIFREQMKDKPENVIDKILVGKLDKYFSEVCLMEQPFIKDGDVKIKDLVTDLVTKIGENIVVKRFARFAVGENS